MLGFVSKYALQYIAEESDRVEYVGLDKSRCGCTIRSTHGLPCACELASFGVGSIPLQSVHLIWTRLSFLDISSDDTSAELSIQQEWAVIMNRFNEVDMAGKINIKADNTSLCPPREKVKTKGALKGRRVNLVDQRSEFLLTLNMLMLFFHSMIVHLG